MANNIQNEIARMKQLMSYGSQKENKHYISDLLEHTARGCDGKTYGIVREGSKYVIKVMKPDANSLIAENFDYIGGMTEKSANTYDSYAKAIKQFDLKMLSLKEAYSPNKGIVIESLDPNRKEYLFLDEVKDMGDTIRRQRQIMLNAQIIREGKNSGPVRGCGECGDASKKGAPFGLKDSKEKYKDAKEEPFDKDGEPKKMNEAEVLGWNDNKDYMDKSHGTEIGDGKPFDKCPKCQTNAEAKNGTVVEGVEEPAPNQVQDWDKGLPKEGGTGKVETKDGTPFDKKASCAGCKNVNESMFEAEDDDITSLDNDDTTPATEGGTDPVADDAPIDDTASQELGSDIDNLDSDMEGADGDIESLLQRILDKLDAIEAKSDDTAGDDSLYGDDTTSDAGPDAEGIEGTTDAAPADDADLGDDTTELGADDAGNMHKEDETVYYESRNYRKLMKEDELHDFGKHPAYRKEPFTYPNPNHNEKEGYHDWNDDSVKGAKPYGEKIGDGTPFNVDPDAIANSIAEAALRILSKKINESKKK